MIRLRRNELWYSALLINFKKRPAEMTERSPVNHSIRRRRIIRHFSSPKD
jgi:hypothetical protein